MFTKSVKGVLYITHALVFILSGRMPSSQEKSGAFLSLGWLIPTSQKKPGGIILELFQLYFDFITDSYDDRKRSQQNIYT